MLCRPDPHSAVEAVGLAVLVRGSGSLSQEVGVEEVEVYFPLPGRCGGSRTVRLAWHRDDADLAPVPTKDR